MRLSKFLTSFGLLGLLSAIFFLNFTFASRDNSKFLDDTFWANNPNTGDIINALYGANSVYVSTWSGYTSDSCNDMNVEYANTLPATLSGNTIYVLTGDVVLDHTVTFNKCSAVVGSGKVEVVVDSDSSYYPLSINQPYSIMDNILIRDGTVSCGVYGESNNITLNRIHIENFAAGLFFYNVSYSYLNGITIANNYGNKNVGEDFVGDGLILYGGQNNKVVNVVSFGNAYGFQLYQSNFNVINNGLFYNNKENGLIITVNSTNNSINNISSFKNGVSSSDNCGIIVLNGSSYNIINNASVYSNYKYGICARHNSNNNIFIDNIVFGNGYLDNGATNINNLEGSTGNKYYGNFYGDSQSVILEQGAQSGSLSNGVFTLLGDDFDDIVNIINPYYTDDGTTTYYLLDFSGDDISGQYGVKSDFNKKVEGYSYGSALPTQAKLYIWSGDEIVTSGSSNNQYIGSNIAEVKGEFRENGKNVVGISSDSEIRKYNVIRLGTGDTIEGVDINVYTGYQSEGGALLGQFVLKNSSNFVHTGVVEDPTVPTCVIEYSTTESTTGSVTATLTGCSEAITGIDSLTYTFERNGTYTFNYTDLVGNTGSTTAKVNWIVTKTSGGGGSSLKKDDCPNGDYSDSYYDGICGKQKITEDVQKIAEDYSQEQRDAYTRAYENGITTMDTIEKADLNGNLTRIAMAKMLSQYAINVLGMKPDESRINEFNDVDKELDSEYDNGVTLAYQLGIMGINMPNNEFRPFDLVPRSEFVTALSRMKYGTSDGEYVGTVEFYKNHMELLNKLGIVTVLDPEMLEVRGYVMIMLMRSLAN